MRSPLRFIGKWISIAALSLAFCEFTVRWWDLGIGYQLRGKGIAGGAEVVNFEFDSVLLYRFRPSSHHRINSLGFRGPEFKPDPPQKSVIVLGDSFPMGMAVAEDATFPMQLQSYIA